MCKTRFDTKIHPLPRTEDAKFESSRGVIIDPAVDAGFGATRRRRSGTAGGCEIRGDSEIHQSAPPKERGFGATRKLTVGKAGRCRIRGNPETHQRRCWRSEDSGQPGDSLTVSPKGARIEETRRSAADSAGRCRIRGNPETHRRRCWRSEV